MSMTRKRVNTRSSSSTSNHSTSDALLPPPKGAKIGSARTVLASTNTNNIKNTNSKSTSTAPSTSAARSSARVGCKRKLSPSMENLNDDEVVTTSKTSPTTTEAKEENSKSGINRKSASEQSAVVVNGDSQALPNNRRVIERLITVSKIYLDCELEVYDEKLHRSLDRMIERFDSAEADMDTTPDDLLPAVTERHLELLNVRMKLLKLNGSGGSVSGASSSVGTAAASTNNIASTSTATTDAAATTDSNKSTPVDIDLNANCFYCRGEHKSEKCTVFPWARRSNIIKKRKRCFSCLQKFTEGHQCNGKCTICDRAHHVSLCKQDPATYVKKVGPIPTVAEKMAKKAAKDAANRALEASTGEASGNRIPPPFPEPPLPTGAEAQRLMTVIEPSSPVFVREPLSINLITSPLCQKPVVYIASITVNVVSASGSALGRCMLNYSSGVGSFVSPRFLARLNVHPTRLPEGRSATVSSFLGSTTVKEYAVLEVRSLYRPAYRFKHLFYVLDVSTHQFHLPSPEVVAMAEAKGIRLSHQYEADRTLNSFDLVMGYSDIELTGFKSTIERMVMLRDPARGINTQAFYTHFGYLLIGTEKEVRGARSSSANVTSSSSGNDGDDHGNGGGRSGGGSSRNPTGNSGSGNRNSSSGRNNSNVTRGNRRNRNNSSGGGGSSRSTGSILIRDVHRLFNGGSNSRYSYAWP